MTMQIISARDYTSADAMRTAARDIRARLFPSKIQRRLPAPEPADDEIKVRKTFNRLFHTRGEPEWMRQETSFDDHVLAYRAFTGSGRKSVKQYVRMRAFELGSSYAEVMSDSHNYRIAFIRHVIIWEVRNCRDANVPTPAIGRLSFPQIGKLFNRDHSSICHAVRRIDRMKAEGKFPAWALPKDGRQ